MRQPRSRGLLDAVWPAIGCGPSRREAVIRGWEREGETDTEIWTSILSRRVDPAGQVLLTPHARKFCGPAITNSIRLHWLAEEGIHSFSEKRQPGLVRHRRTVNGTRAMPQKEADAPPAMEETDQWAVDVMEVRSRGGDVSKIPFRAILPRWGGGEAAAH